MQKQILGHCMLSLPAVMESEFYSNERRLLDLSAEIEILNGRMMGYSMDIQIVAKFHRTCTI